MSLLKRLSFNVNLIAGALLLSSSISPALSADPYYSLELREIKPIDTAHEESNKGQYIAVFSFNTNNTDNFLSPNPYKHLKSQETQSTIPVFDDDGALTFAVLSRFFQELYVHNKSVSQQSLDEFLNSPMIRPDLFIPLLQYASNRMLTKLPQYEENEEKKKGNAYCTHKYAKAIPIINQHLETLTTSRSYTFSQFFSTYARWIQNNSLNFVSNTKIDGKQLSYESLDIRPYFPLDSNHPGWSNSFMTCHFGKIITQLEHHLAALPRTSLLTEHQKELIFGNAAQLTTLSTLTNQLIENSDLSQNQLLSGLDIWHLLSITSHLPDAHPLRANLATLGLSTPLSYYTALKSMATDSKIIDFYNAVLLPKDLKDTPLPEALKDSELWFRLGDNANAIAKEINDKVAEKTRNLITDFINESDLFEIKMGIFATTYLKTFWEKKFDKEIDGTFTTAMGEEKTIRFLKTRQRIGYSKDDSGLYVDIPLKGNAHYLIWMPNDKPTKLPILSPTCVTFKLGKVELTYPKLDIQQRTELFPLCQKIGLTTLEEPVWGKIVPKSFFQRARLKTTLEGVEAAAATGMTFKAASIVEYPNIDIDKPHMMSIALDLGNQQYLPVFTGWIAQG